jgi:aspartyl-tRNA(Asn)/glutamyl-tRNA(Gln) amidotransferase subunit C
MSVDAKDIEKVATLSRIQISPEQIPEVTNSINTVLGLIDKMQTIDTSQVEPLANPHDALQTLRADEVTATDERDTLMSNAPSAQDGLFVVPKVIE